MAPGDLIDYLRAAQTKRQSSAFTSKRCIS